VKWMTFNLRPSISAVTCTVSVLAFLISCGGLYVAKKAYDLSAVRDAREISAQAPAIDVQVRQSGTAVAAVIISITNRSNMNIAPQWIAVLPSLQAGVTFFSSKGQKIDDLKSSLSLLSMGTIKPKETVSTNAVLSGQTDGKWDNFSDAELPFVVRIRFGDDADTFQSFELTRRIGLSAK
jgi:hypothetical protein